MGVPRLITVDVLPLRVRVRDLPLLGAAWLLGVDVPPLGRRERNNSRHSPFGIGPRCRVPGRCDVQHSYCAIWREVRCLYEIIGLPSRKALSTPNSGTSAAGRHRVLRGRYVRSQHPGRSQQQYRHSQQLENSQRRLSVRFQVRGTSALRNLFSTTIRAVPTTVGSLVTT